MWSHSSFSLHRRSFITEHTPLTGEETTIVRPVGRRTSGTSVVMSCSSIVKSWRSGSTRQCPLRNRFLNFKDLVHSQTGYNEQPPKRCFGESKILKTQAKSVEMSIWFNPNDWLDYNRMLVWIYKRKNILCGDFWQSVFLPFFYYDHIEVSENHYTTCLVWLNMTIDQRLNVFCHTRYPPVRARDIQFQ